MRNEFVPFLTSGPVYVGTVLSELGEDVRNIIITDEVECMQHLVTDDWRTCVPVYVLNKEVKNCTIYEEKGVRVLNIRV